MNEVFWGIQKVSMPRFEAERWDLQFGSGPGASGAQKIMKKFAGPTAQRRVRSSTIFPLAICYISPFDLYDAAAPWGPRPPKVRWPQLGRSSAGAPSMFSEASKNRPKKTMIFLLILGSKTLPFWFQNPPKIHHFFYRFFTWFLVWFWIAFFLDFCWVLVPKLIENWLQIDTRWILKAKRPKARIYCKLQ